MAVDVGADDEVDVGTAVDGVAAIIQPRVSQHIDVKDFFSGLTRCRRDNT